MDLSTFKSVAEIGISSTIAVIFLRQQQRLFTYLRKYDIIETCDERVFVEV